MRSAFSSTRKCLEIAGTDIEKGRASSVPEASPRARCSNMARRVGSESARKTVSSRCDESLTMKSIIISSGACCQRHTTDFPERPPGPPVQYQVVCFPDQRVLYGRPPWLYLYSSCEQPHSFSVKYALSISLPPRV